MIDDATIKKIARECWPDLPDHWWDKKDGAVWNATSSFAKACYAAGQDAQMKHALYIGAVTEDGVVWANQNPSSYPVGAMFYAVIPKEP